MKSVLISIQPKWCELITSGKKTVEVRKTKPKIETPFKCYIYCTQGKLKDLGVIGQTMYEKRMKVIGEFICDRVVEFENNCYEPAFEETADLSCVGFKGLYDYLGTNDKGYGWHISDLVIYDKPKELSEFASFCYKVNCCGCEHFQVVENLSSPFVGSGRYNIKCVCDHLKPLKRPPQSWCYVYAEEGDNNEYTDYN